MGQCNRLIRKGFSGKEGRCISIFTEGYESELAVVVSYDFSPAEAGTHFEPGCEATVEVTSIMLGDVELIGIVDSEGVEEMERNILLDLDPADLDGQAYQADCKITQMKEEAMMRRAV